LKGFLPQKPTEQEKGCLLFIFGGVSNDGHSICSSYNSYDQTTKYLQIEIKESAVTTLLPSLYMFSL
jgi:hypothetical protein